VAKYKKIEEFARKQGVDFYPAGRGIGHQVMVEEGYAFPLNLTVASDSHSNMYGGIGSLGTPVVRTDGMAPAAVDFILSESSGETQISLFLYLSSGGALGDGKDLVAGATGGQGELCGEDPPGGNREGYHHHPLRALQ